ncbi:hypothetical protein ACC736_39085, partial [Rhizobium ruizarguesonis]
GAQRQQILGTRTGADQPDLAGHLVHRVQQPVGGMPGLRQVPIANRIETVRAAFSAEQVEGSELVFAATGNEADDRSIVDAA